MPNRNIHRANQRLRYLKKQANHWLYGYPTAAAELRQRILFVFNRYKKGLDKENSLFHPPLSPISRSIHPSPSPPLPPTIILVPSKFPLYFSLPPAFIIWFCTPLPPYKKTMTLAQPPSLPSLKCIFFTERWKISIRKSKNNLRCWPLILWRTREWVRICRS